MNRVPSLAVAAWVCAPGKSGPRPQVLVAASNTSLVLSTSTPFTYPPNTYSFDPTRATPPSTRVCGDCAAPADQSTENGADESGADGVPGAGTPAGETVTKF